jgi:hypothetical protein
VPVGALLLAFAAASFLHHAHNATFLEHYPNLPGWITPTVVYAAWLGATAVGVIGYWLRLRVLVAAYAGYGLFALAHYALAPISAHSFGMNLSIGLEAGTAAALLVRLLSRPEPRGK